jgi:hypothetical protein
MPTYNSKDGVWTPAQEKVALTNFSKETKVINGKEIVPGEPYIYEGPDRAAEFELFQAGEKQLGQAFWEDPDMIDRARQLGYKDVMAYAKARGWKKEESDKQFNEKAKIVLKHEPPKKSKEKKIIGGGVDATGSGKDIIGGFGDERVRPADELD